MAMRSGDSTPLSADCCGDREHQSGEQRSQVALRRQHQQPARATAGEDHAGTEHRTADQGARQAAARRELARVLHVQPAGQDEGLGQQHRGGEGEQPHRELAFVRAAGKFDHRRAQAEARSVGKEAEQQSDQRPGGRDGPALAQAGDGDIDQGVHLEGL
jgi:hypothetical protein